MLPQPAYILVARPYRETSLLIEAFCLEHGRIAAMARGVRSARGQSTRALLQPLQPLRLAWRGRGELPTLSFVEATRPAHPIAPASLLSVFYLNELLLRLLERYDPHPALFERYAGVLDELAQGQAVPWILRRFERDLLAECGYALQLESDVDGAPIEPDALYRYDPERGPWRCSEGGAGCRGDALIALRGDIEPAVPVERACRVLLRGLLERHANGRIKSLALSRRGGA